MREHISTSILRSAVIYALLCVGITSNGFAQTAPKIRWQQCYGGTGADGATRVSSTSDGGFVLTGYTESQDGDVIFNRGAGDAWVMKLSSSGRIQWQKTYGGSGLDVARGAIETADGGFVVAGSTASNDGDVVGHHPSQGQSAFFAEDTLDAWVFKISKHGEIEWQRCIGGSARDEITGLAPTSDGGYIVVGNTESNAEDWPNHGGRDVFVVKLDSIGNINWLQQYGGSSLDAGSSIIQTDDGGYIFTGSSVSNDGDVGGNHTASDPNRSSDAWVVRLNHFGKILWQRCYGGTASDQGHGIIPTNTGGFLICAEASSNDGDVMGLHAAVNPPVGVSDAWLIRIDSLGAIEWQRCLGGGAGDIAYSAIEDSIGNFIVACGTSSLDGDVTKKHGGADTADVWIIKLSASGNLIWQICYGGMNFESGSPYVFATPTGQILFSAITRSKDGDVIGNHGADDGWLVELAPEGSSIESVESSNGLPFPFPNPALNEVHMDLSHSQTVQSVAFFTILGTQCYPKYRIEGTVLTVDLQSLSTGGYIMRANYPDFEGRQIGKDIRRFVVSK